MLLCRYHPKPSVIQVQPVEPTPEATAPVTPEPKPVAAKRVYQKRSEVKVNAEPEAPATEPTEPVETAQSAVEPEVELPADEPKTEE
jgi:hypothetical protein